MGQGPKAIKRTYKGERKCALSGFLDFGTLKTNGVLNREPLSTGIWHMPEFIKSTTYGVDVCTENYSEFSGRQIEETHIGENNNNNTLKTNGVLNREPLSTGIPEFVTIY